MKMTLWFLAISALLIVVALGIIADKTTHLDPPTRATGGKSETVAQYLCTNPKAEFVDIGGIHFVTNSGAVPLSALAQSLGQNRGGLARLEREVERSFPVNRHRVAAKQVGFVRDACRAAGLL